MLLLAAAATPAAATSCYGGYTTRRLSGAGGAYAYGAYRRLAGAAVQPALLPGARRLFGAWEPHAVPVPARLAAASRALAGYGYYSVRWQRLGWPGLAWGRRPWP